MKTYRVVVYDQNHKVADAKAFVVSDETCKLYVTVEDKRFELLLPAEYLFVPLWENMDEAEKI